MLLISSTSSISGLYAKNLGFRQKIETFHTSPRTLKKDRQNTHFFTLNIYFKHIHFSIFFLQTLQRLS
jgi:hypothetical protein